MTQHTNNQQPRKQPANQSTNTPQKVDSPTLQHILDVSNRLVSYMKDFSRFFFTRSESNTEEIRAYINGLLQAKHRAANMERMEEEVENFNYLAVHNCITHSPWESRPVMDDVAQRAIGLLGGGPRTRLIFDDTGVLKKGNHSVGVAR